MRGSSPIAPGRGKGGTPCWRGPPPTTVGKRLLCALLLVVPVLTTDALNTAGTTVRVCAGHGVTHSGPAGTTKTGVTPSPAQTPRQLIIHGGFLVDDGRPRQPEQPAQRLGLADLRRYLQAHSDAGLSIPQLAAELGVRKWTVKQALSQAGVTLPPRAERLAQQRRHATQQRLTAQTTQLGFTDVRAYLADRLVTRAWPLAEVTAELGAHRRTVRRLMEEHGIQRTRRTAGEVAAGERGRRAQATVWQARRAERLAGLGFPDPAGYLQRRRLEQAGRSGACGPSFGSGGAGWPPSWPGWACGADTGQDSSLRTSWRVPAVLGRGGQEARP
jgi:AraC-like DNA-binding protein